jgi:hypothetical protein
MFFEKFKAVFITLLNRKTPFYSFVFSVRSIEYFNAVFQELHLNLEIQSININ